MSRLFHASAYFSKIQPIKLFQKSIGTFWPSHQDLFNRLYSTPLVGRNSIKQYQAALHTPLYATSLVNNAFGLRLPAMATSTYKEVEPCNHNVSFEDLLYGNLWKARNGRRTTLEWPANSFGMSYDQRQLKFLY